jgi:hypothetical protein
MSSTLAGIRRLFTEFIEKAQSPIRRSLDPGSKLTTFSNRQSKKQLFSITSTLAGIVIVPKLASLNADASKRCTFDSISNAISQGRGSGLGE